MKREFIVPTVTEKVCDGSNAHTFDPTVGTGATLIVPQDSGYAENDALSRQIEQFEARWA